MGSTKDVVFVVCMVACFCFKPMSTTKANQPRGGRWEVSLSAYVSDQLTYNKIKEDVKDSAKKGLATCKEVFKDDKWNCDVSERKLLIHKGKQIIAFSGNVLPADKEGAYIQALASASAMYTLTSNCRLGRYDDCSCVPINKPKPPDQKWRWAGCNENFRFGEHVSEHFVDSLEKKGDGRAALNLFNNEVGRKVVRTAAQRKCKCHGPTASCVTQTCWRKLLNFTEVGKLLKVRYDSAVHVKYVSETLKPFSDSSAGPITNGRHGNLAFFENSRNFCDPDERTGYPGIQNRKCIYGNDGGQSCARRCASCGRRIRQTVETKTEKCQCQFVWCCQIHCEFCTKQQNVTTCL